MKKIYSLLMIIIPFLFLLSGCKKEENPVVPPTEHFEPEGWSLYTKARNEILVVWQGEIQQSWNSTSTEIVRDTLTAFLSQVSGLTSVRFLDSDKNLLNPPEDPDYEFSWVITDTSYISIIKSGNWGYNIQGKKAGITTLELQVLHLGHVDVRTPKIPVRVQ